MSDPCPGQTSSPKAGVPETIIYSASAIGLLLEKRGYGWALLVAPLLNVLSYDAINFCSADPPDVPTFSDDDVRALLQVDIANGFGEALGKLVDLAKNVLWYELCKCDAGAAAVAPAAPDPRVYPNAGYSAGLCVPMRRAEVKVLNLWNGTTNVSPPGGWQLPGFNDSAWPAASNPALQFSNDPDCVGVGLGINPTGVGCAQCKPEAIAPWVTPSSNHRSQFLFRWRFYLPVGADPNYIGLQQFYGSGTGVGWGSGLAWINGLPAAGYVNFNSAGIQQALKFLSPGQYNTIAMWVDSGAGANPTSDLWGDYGWVTMMMSQSYSGLAPASTDCAALQALLGQLLQLTTLIQRQGVPFAYILGESDPGLTGAGEIALGDPILGVKVVLTTIPASYGIEYGDPDTHFDLGEVSIGDGDGWFYSRRLDRESTVWIPSGAGAATKIGYTLAPGVVATITQLIREP